MKERFDDRLPDPPVAEQQPKEAARTEERVRQTFLKRIRESTFVRGSGVKMVLLAYGLTLGTLKDDRVGKEVSVHDGQGEDEEGTIRERMEAYFGPDLLAEQVDIPADEARGRNAKTERPADLEGFEEALGIRHETVEKLLRTGYPRGFGGDEAVERIRYSYERIAMPERYGIPGYEEGHCTVSRGAGASEIVLTVDGLPSRVLTSADFQIRSGFGRLLSHELAHAADWQNATGLEPEERLELLSEVVARVEGAQPIPYEYVQRIQNPHGDRQAQRLDRAREYFAELMKDVFDVPSNYFAAYPTERAIAGGLAERHGGQASQYLGDARLIIRHIRRLDPHFNWERAAVAREQVLNTLSQERAEALMVQACRGLRLPELGDALVSVFQTSQHKVMESTDWSQELEHRQVASRNETWKLSNDWAHLVRLAVRGRFDTRLPLRNDHEVATRLVMSINDQLENLRHDQAMIDRFREEALGSLVVLER